MIGVAWNGSESAMVGFAQRHGLTFPNLRDDDGSLFARFEVSYQPAFVFVGADGRAERVITSLDAEALDARLRALADG